MIGVVLAGVDKRLLDGLAVDDDRGLVSVFLDDREQIAEQPSLALGELGALDRAMGRGMVDSVNRRPRAWDERAAVLRGRGAFGAIRTALRGGNGRRFAVACDGTALGGGRRPT